MQDATLASHRPRRRWFRFSLRTLCILLTLFLIWLGYHANRAHRQRTAVRTIESLGSSVVYDRQIEQLYAPRWLVTLAGPDFFRNATSVSLSCRMEGRQGRPLTAPELDTAIAAMSDLPCLRRLQFSMSGVTDDDLVRFAPLADRIEELVFTEYRLTGDGFRHLAGWPRVRSLVIGGDQFRASTLLVAPKLPSLESLSWHGPLDAPAFAALGQCKQLRDAGLLDCPFHGEDFALLGAAPRLRSITLHNLYVMDARGFQGAAPDGRQGGPPYYDFTPGPEGHSGPVLASPGGKASPELKQWLDRTLPNVEVTFWSIRMGIAR